MGYTIRIRTLLVFAGLATLAAAQTPAAKSPCTLVTPEDAATILGPNVDKYDDPLGRGCVYQDKGHKMYLLAKTVSGPNVKTGFEIPKAMISRSGGTVRDEPGLGAGA
jgi:hypothetical protein